VCNISAGWGIPTDASAHPDGSALFTGNGTCQVTSVLVYDLDGPGTSVTPVTTSNGESFTTKGHRLRFVVVATWSGGPIGIAAYVWWWQDSTRTRYAMPATTSGATVQIDEVVPITGFFTAAALCSIDSKDQDQFNFATGGDSGNDPGGNPAGYHGTPNVPTGPGGGGTPGTDVDPGACFNGLFYNVDFYGLASFPWVHITQAPGDALCFLKVLIVPQAGDLSNFATSSQADFSTSAMHPLWTVFDAPFAAISSFVSAADTGDCHGVTVHYPQVSDGSFGTTDRAIQPFDACSGNMATAATIVKLAFTLSLWIGAFWLCVRMLAAAFAAEPIAATADFAGGSHGYSFPESSGNSPEQGGSFG
jgi:hypothetical protein